MVVSDADEAARNISVHKALPIRPGRVWRYVPVVAGLCAGAYLWLPQMDLAGLAHAREIQERERAEAETAREALAKTLTTIEQAEANQPETADGDLQQQELLDQIAQLTQQDLSDSDLRREAAAKLSEAREQLAEQALKKEQELRPVENMLTRLDTEQPGPADDFASALRRGDMGAAQQALQDLAQQVDSMPDADREALAQQLQSLAEQLEQAAHQQQQMAQQQQQQAEQAMRDAGMTQEQIDQAQQLSNNPQALQQQLQDQGMSQQDAQRLAEQVSQAQQNGNQSNNGQQCANGLSEALRRMQQAAQNQQGGGQGQQNQQGGQGQQQQQAQGQQQQQSGQQGGGQSFQQAAGGASDQLNQIARMREQLAQTQRAQSQAQDAMDQLARGGGGQAGNQNQQDGSGGDKKDQNAGVGGHQAGTGEGGNPLGEHQFAGPYNVRAEDDIQDGSGRIIASWMQQGPSYAGEPNVEYDQAVTDARQHAEKAVTEDRVPQRYHQTIRQYFDQIPESADQIQSPPPAPN